MLTHALCQEAMHCSGGHNQDQQALCADVHSADDSRHESVAPVHMQSIAPLSGSSRVNGAVA